MNPSAPVQGLAFEGMPDGAIAVEIWHNPACGTSRNALALIRHVGIEPTIVEYLVDPPGEARLRQAIAAAGLSVREAIRSKEPAYLAAGLDDASLADDALLEAMLAHPELINRPFVFTPAGVRLCRPDSSMVLDILPPCDRPFAKEDGEVVIDERGQRVR
jgi:arsenate reductase